MSQNYFLIIVGFLFLLMVWGNMMYRKAAKSLPPEKQIDLAEVQRSYQMWTIGLILGLMALFFLMNKTGILPFNYLAIGFVVIILLVYGAINYMTYQKMRKLDFDAEFLRKYLMVNGIRLFAIVFLLVVVLLKGKYFNS